MTVRDLVAGMQKEIGEGHLEPQRACDLLGKLTALLGNCREEIRDADYEFNIVLLHYLDQDEAANRARIRAETTAEYRRKQQARDTKTLAEDLISALKYSLRSMEAEWKFNR